MTHKWRFQFLHTLDKTIERAANNWLLIVLCCTISKALNKYCYSTYNCDSYSGQNVQMYYLIENILLFQILPWFHLAIDALAGAVLLHWPTSDIDNRETLRLEKEVQYHVWLLWTSGRTQKYMVGSSEGTFYNTACWDSIRKCCSQILFCQFVFFLFCFCNIKH